MRSIPRRTHFATRFQVRKQNHFNIPKEILNSLIIQWKGRAEFSRIPLHGRNSIQRRRKGIGNIPATHLPIANRIG